MHSETVKFTKLHRLTNTPTRFGTRRLLEDGAGGLGFLGCYAMRLVNSSD